MRYLPLFFFAFLLNACQIGPTTDQQSDERARPAPTTGTLVHYGEEAGGKGDYRRAWEEKVHKAAPGVDWRAVEYGNLISRHRERTVRRAAGATGRSGQISLAGGQVEGEWQEKGSSNQAGSVHDLVFDPATETIYTIADGGSFWKVEVATESWTMLNHELRFTRRLLQHFPSNGESERLVAAVMNRPHYSDDGGISWTASELEFALDFSSSSARINRSAVANEGQLYFMARTSSQSRFRLYGSSDRGSSIQTIYNPGNSVSLLDIVKPHHRDELLLLQRQGDSLQLLRLDTAQLSPQLIGSSPLPSELTNYDLIAAYRPDGSLKVMIYGEDQLFESNDFGNNWSNAGPLPIDPWDVGVFMKASNPDHLLTGGVNLFYSNDNGANWQLSSEWWEYYNNVEYKIHADIMFIAEFQNAAGEYNTFISNHGGLSVSTGDPTSNYNLSLNGHNNAQYYSTITKPGSEDVIYAGSQDQGLQWSTTTSEGIETFDQVISGDYGNLAYSHVNDEVYAMYPFGSLTKWNTQNTGNMGWYDLESEDEFIWITPFMVAPDPVLPSEEIIYVAGGSANGGPGSYLIRVTDTDSSPFNADFSAENLPFNFLEGNGQLSAVNYSPINPSRLYVATENGRFFSSNDAGLSWEPTINFLPQGFYLYGQAIYASRLDSNRVWFGGSGYSNPAIYQSDDGGENFYSISEGLPPTTVLRVTANNDESLLFAATESGPYVYVVAEGSWYDLSGLDAPAGRYYSVEWLAQSNVARFATYNRGVWDFKVATEVVSVAGLRQALPDWTAFPNPTNGPLTLRQLPTGSQTVRVTDLNGRIIEIAPTIDLSQQAAGVYLLTPLDGRQQAIGRTKRIVVR